MVICGHLPLRGERGAASAVSESGVSQGLAQLLGCAAGPIVPCGQLVAEVAVMGSGRQEDPMLGCGSPIRGRDSEFPIQERGQQPHPEPSVPLFHMMTGLLHCYLCTSPLSLEGSVERAMPRRRERA